MSFPKRMSEFGASTPASDGYGAQDFEAAMAENEGAMLPDMGMGGAPDNSLHATDVALPSPEDSPARWNMGMPPAKLDPNQLVQSDFEDPAIIGDLLTQTMQEDAMNSEEYQQGAMEDAEQDGLQNKKLFGM
jgi:hypothetical protein